VEGGLQLGVLEATAVAVVFVVSVPLLFAYSDASMEPHVAIITGTENRQEIQLDSRTKNHNHHLHHKFLFMASSADAIKDHVGFLRTWILGRLVYLKGYTIIG